MVRYLRNIKQDIVSRGNPLWLPKKTWEMEAQQMEGINVIYKGPSCAINVGQFGSHAKGAVKAYPAEFSTMLASEEEHVFEIVEQTSKKGKKAEAE
jgi:hypothetical protein